MDPRRIPLVPHVGLDDAHARDRENAGLELHDDQLVAQAAKGDGIAFTRLVTRHQSRLLALTLRTVGDRALAEDIVQEVFTRAWVHAPSWRSNGLGRASYAAWLSRVAVNLVIDRVRRAKPVTLDEIVEPEDPAPLADAAMIAREREARVKAAIAGLPERQRLALSLTYDAGLSNSDGAAAIGTSVGAFELLLVRARRTLRRTLRES